MPLLSRTFPGVAQVGTSEKGHLRAGGHKHLWARQRGSRETPCFTEGLPGGQRGKVHQSAWVTTLLRNKLPPTVPHPPDLGWAHHKCGCWLMSEGVCSLYRASSSSSWDQPWLPVMAMAEVPEGEQKQASTRQACYTC